MRRPAHAAAGMLLALATAVSVAAAVSPGWAGRHGLDAWNFPDAARDRDEVAAETRRLDRVGGEALRRSAALNATVADLAAGRVTLRDAAGRAVEYGGVWYAATLAFNYPDDPEDVAAARHVILLALTRVEDPTERADAERRLRAEFEVVHGRPLPEPVHPQPPGSRGRGRRG